jgi:hypothetical protein
MLIVIVWQEHAMYMNCVPIPLFAVPAGDWHCPDCYEPGHDHEDAGK